MSESKYAKYVNPLRLWTEIARPSFRGKMADFSLLFDEQVYPDTRCWVEIFYAYAPGAGVGIPDTPPAIIRGKERTTSWGQHAHPGFDELFLFFGTDPRDNTRLGGDVEAWTVTRVDNPKYPIIIMVIALSLRYDLQQNDWRDLPHPPAFSMDMLGKEQPGKGLYTDNVKRIPMAPDRIFP